MNVTRRDFLKQPETPDLSFRSFLSIRTNQRSQHASIFMSKTIHSACPDDSIILKTNGLLFKYHFKERDIL